MNPESFWRVTFEFRAEKRISQEEMAFQIDLSVKSYAEIERAEVPTNRKSWTVSSDRYAASSDAPFNQNPCGFC